MWQDAWAGILGMTRDAIRPSLHLFRAGAGSMDVTRLIEEVKEKCGGIQLSAEEVYMAPTFLEFHNLLINRSAGLFSIIIAYLSTWRLAPLFILMACHFLTN